MSRRIWRSFLLQRLMWRFPPSRRTKTLLKLFKTHWARRRSHQPGREPLSKMTATKLKISSVTSWQSWQQPRRDLSSALELRKTSGMTPCTEGTCLLEMPVPLQRRPKTQMQRQLQDSPWLLLLLLCYLQRRRTLPSGQVRQHMRGWRD